MEQPPPHRILEFTALQFLSSKSMLAMMKFCFKSDGDCCNHFIIIQIKNTDSSQR